MDTVIILSAAVYLIAALATVRFAYILNIRAFGDEDKGWPLVCGAAWPAFWISVAFVYVWQGLVWFWERVLFRPVDK